VTKAWRLMAFEQELFNILDMGFRELFYPAIE
jgi:hypothetical protein